MECVWKEVLCLDIMKKEILHCPITLGLWHKLLVYPIWFGSRLRVSEIGWLSHLEDWETQSEVRLFGELLALLCFELCGKREMLRFLRKGWKRKGCFRIYFTSIPTFGPLVLSLLKEFYLMLFNLVGLRFLIQKGWITFFFYQKRRKIY